MIQACSKWSKYDLEQPKLKYVWLDNFYAWKSVWSLDNIDKYFHKNTE